jgi:hypothetical protein
MTRRQALLALAGALALQRATDAMAAAAMGAPWAVLPSVGVVGPTGDPRLPLVHDAIEFWNGVFASLGSPFRLGPVTAVAGAIPAGELVALSQATVGGSGAPPLPASVMAVPGNIVVALSDGDFVSFCARRLQQGKALVAIKSERSFPLTLPNVARNVIAHELGHSIGLAHNSDPTLLMCGRPAPCRPDAFQSAQQHYFPLADDERALLLRLYPTDWRPRQS